MSFLLILIMITKKSIFNIYSASTCETNGTSPSIVDPFSQEHQPLQQRPIIPSRYPITNGGFPFNISHFEIYAGGVDEICKGLRGLSASYIKWGWFHPLYRTLDCESRDACVDFPQVEDIFDLSDHVSPALKSAFLYASPQIYFRPFPCLVQQKITLWASESLPRCEAFST